MAKIPSTSEIRETAGFAGGLLRQARLAWRLLWDSRVPGWVKLIPMGALIYLLSPVDFVPDLVFPGIGQVDDLVVLLLALKAFVDVSPPDIVREHLQQLFGKAGDIELTQHPSSGGSTIDVPYRIVADDENKQ